MTETQAEKFARAAKEREQVATPGRGRRYYLKRAVIEILAGYLVLCLILFIFQRKFIYLPSRESDLSPQKFGFAKQQAEALESTAEDGVTIRGWHVNSGRGGPELAKAPLVDLFFCGNAGNRSDRSDTFHRLTSLGPHVACFDYRGYGDSDGAPGEEGLARDARAAWDCLEKKGVKPEHIVVHGESLGAAVALRLAAEKCAAGTPPAGLVLEAPFTSMKDVAAKHYWYVPARLLLRDTFPSLERIPQVTCPILILHGRRDDVVPFGFGQELFSAAPPQSGSGVAKQFVELPDCGHNDIGLVDRPQYREALGGFYTALCPELAPKKSDGAVPRKPLARKPRPHGMP
ncbi:MAG: alpha/beta hydrolase [Planctomycetota bacterium]